MADHESLKVGNFFKTKKPGMFIAKIKPDKVEEMKALFNSRRAGDQGVVFFLFENTKGNTDFSLMANIDKPYEKKEYNEPAGKRTIDDWDGDRKPAQEEGRSKRPEREPEPEEGDLYGKSDSWD